MTDHSILCKQACRPGFFSERLCLILICLPGPGEGPLGSCLCLPGFPAYPPGAEGMSGPGLRSGAQLCPHSAKGFLSDPHLGLQSLMFRHVQGTIQEALGLAFQAGKGASFL